MFQLRDGWGGQGTIGMREGRLNLVGDWARKSGLDFSRNIITGQRITLSIYLAFSLYFGANFSSFPFFPQRFFQVIIIFYSTMIGYQLSKPQISKSYFFLLIRISKCYLYFYILQILISLALLIALLLNRQTIATFLQITACLLLACDLQLRCVSEGLSSFFKSRLNIVDTSVFLIILSMVAADFLFPELIHHPEEDISLAFLILRYTIQLWRVVQLSRQSKKQFEINTLEEINLNSIHQQDNDINIPT